LNAILKQCRTPTATTWIAMETSTRVRRVDGASTASETISWRAIISQQCEVWWNPFRITWRKMTSFERQTQYGRRGRLGKLQSEKDKALVRRHDTKLLWPNSSESLECQRTDINQNQRSRHKPQENSRTMVIEVQREWSYN